MSSSAIRIGNNKYKMLRTFPLLMLKSMPMMT